ncbi:MAG: hypothetical protein ACI4VF_00805, partial [Lachnospirales bacterium]
MILDSKNYIYTVSDCNKKKLKDKITYTSKINKDIEVSLNNDDIIIKKKNTGRKNNSAFIGKISESGKNCKITGTFPDEKNMKFMLIFVAVWYFMFVFFTWGKMDILNTVVAYTVGGIFIIALVVIFLVT